MGGAQGADTHLITQTLTTNYHEGCQRNHETMTFRQRIPTGTYAMSRSL